MLQPCCTHAQHCPNLTKPAFYNCSTRHVSVVPVRPRLAAAQLCQLRLPYRSSQRGRTVVSAKAAGNQPEKSQTAAQPVSKQSELVGQHCVPALLSFIVSTDLSMRNS